MSYVTQWTIASHRNLLSILFTLSFFLFLLFKSSCQPFSLLFSSSSAPLTTYQSLSHTQKYKDIHTHTHTLSYSHIHTHIYIHKQIKKFCDLILSEKSINQCMKKSKDGKERKKHFYLNFDFFWIFKILWRMWKITIRKFNINIYLFGI